jgi:hypothetical protein
VLQQAEKTTAVTLHTGKASAECADLSIESLTLTGSLKV